jgi:hypothetical protein
MTAGKGLPVGLALLALVAPPAAGAATLHVDDDAPAGNLDCTQAAPCNTVTKAIAEARTIDGPDLITVAAGVYIERVVMNQPLDDAGNTIQGAGPTATVIRHPGGVPDDAALQLGGVIVPPPGALTAAGLSVEVPAGVNKPGISVSGAGATLRNVAIDMRSAPNFYSGIAAQGSADNLTVDRVSIGGDWAGGGIYSQSTGMRLRDSVVETNAARPLDLSADDMRVERTRLVMGGSGEAVLALNAEVTISSSLILGGGTGVSGYQSELGLRGVTIDTGAPQVSDEGGIGVRVYGDPGIATSAAIDSSIVLEPFAAETNGIGTITCAASDVSDRTEPPGGDDVVECGAAGGNTTTPPGQLFAAPGDWHLAVASPAIDSGTAGALGPFDSPTDLDGNPRLLDGNFDCEARRDKGAYEKAGQECLPADTIDPLLSELSMTNRRFRVDPAAAARKRRRAPVGTRFRYTLSEPAGIGVMIDRLVPGRRVGGKCRKVTRRNRARRKCKRFRRAGRLAYDGVLGRNSSPFSGRIGRRKMRPGRFRATFAAIDKAGNASGPSRIRFRIVRR